MKNDKSLYNMHPELIKYVLDVEKAKYYSHHSGKRIMCKCPVCGSTKELIIENLSRNGFHCTVCGDGISYPNKFMNELLRQVGITYETEKIFSWSGKRRYDQYLPDFNTIIENNGLQHYLGDRRFQFPMQDLSMQSDRDEIKRELAVRNNISHYVVIDCSYSNKEWIKEHVMKSELPMIIGFCEEDIDWDKCSKVASNSIVKEVWELWNKGIPSFEIEKRFDVGITTIRNYIKRGVECGVCKTFYNADKETKSIRAKKYPFTNGQMKPIYCEDDNVYFSSRFECEKYYPDLFPENTGSYQLYKCVSKDKPYKGKRFVYVTKEHFNEMLEKSKNDDSLTVIGKPFRL